MLQWLALGVWSMTRYDFPVFFINQNILHIFTFVMDLLYT